MPVTSGDLIKRGRLLYGRRTALIYEDKRFTYAAQAERMFRLANALIAKGVTKQQRVAVLARNCSEYVEIFGACEVAGFVAINLNSRLSAIELGAICRDCQPSVLIHAKDLAKEANSLATEVPSISLRIGIDTDQGDVLSYEKLLAEASAEEPPISPTASDIAYLMYTSGTTGGAKGVMISHAAMTEAARMLSQEGGLGSIRKALIVMPLFHLGGKIEQMAFNLMGAAVVLKAAFDADDILQTMENEKVEAAHFAPLMIQRMLDVLDSKSYDLSALRCVHYASAPMPVPTLRRALSRMGPVFVQVYGMTECVVGTVLKPDSHLPDGDEDERQWLRSAGQPFLGNEFKIAREDGSLCPPGEIGEILFRSPSVMNGYWNKSVLTAEVLRDGWFHTQDLGLVDNSGFIYVVDRKKDMIISGGENIYSWEVEEALRAHPAVAEVAVIAVPDEQWGEAVKACVQMRPGASARDEDLIEYVRSRIASYKKPKSVDFVESLPRLFNGKIDKKALRAPYWEGHERQVS
ncbi:MAG TPA: long-chain-fatty-acid--CoA ligase [Xanthobacteraceae bacterium]|jgi:acyl-CoA synthetase (AMP-forming)/AMP-acid ligase II|nr:long-chain-fatty-acid--CoA ligase [Xanthobacteraceae bacterium]